MEVEELGEMSANDFLNFGNSIRPFSTNTTVVGHHFSTETLNFSTHLIIMNRHGWNTKLQKFFFY